MTIPDDFPDEETIRSWKDTLDAYQRIAKALGLSLNDFNLLSMSWSLNKIVADGVTLANVLAAGPFKLPLDEGEEWKDDDNDPDPSNPDGWGTLH